MKKDDAVFIKEDVTLKKSGVQTVNSFLAEQAPSEARKARLQGESAGLPVRQNELTTGTTVAGESNHEIEKKSGMVKISSKDKENDQKKKSKSDEFLKSKKEDLKDSTTKTKEKSKEQKAIEERKKKIVPSILQKSGGNKILESKDSAEKKEKSANTLPTKSQKSVPSKN
uniref:Uncharacterized protein n=1 Tax=Panagrolaimus davidi TaxID=227884 RepID=A0A914Q740_9BILA